MKNVLGLILSLLSFEASAASFYESQQAIKNQKTHQTEWSEFVHTLLSTAAIGSCSLEMIATSPDNSTYNLFITKDEQKFLLPIVSPTASHGRTVLLRSSAFATYKISGVVGWDVLTVKYQNTVMHGLTLWSDFTQEKIVTCE